MNTRRGFMQQAAFGRLTKRRLVFRDRLEPVRTVLFYRRWREVTGDRPLISNEGSIEML